MVLSDMSSRFSRRVAGALLVAAGLVAGCVATRQAVDSPAAGLVGADAWQANADRWNAVFEMQPGAAYGWSGGDAAISLALPFCGACPADSRHRRLWLFGDSAFSTVDQEGYRVKADGERGADYVFGNVAAITAHAAPSEAAARDIGFDYGARGLRSNSWMPLLLDPRQLPDMDALRIAARGYADLGYSRAPEAVAGVYSLPELAPEHLRGDLVAVHEYHDPASRATDYATRDGPAPAGAYGFRRVAFHVFRSPHNDTVPLFRYRSAARGDVVLGTSPRGAAGSGQLLGHVYARESERRNVHALVEYSRADAARQHVDRVYTTRPNDGGKDILMWPNRGLVIGNDLLQVFSPVTPLDLAGMVPWDDIDRNVVSIVRGVDRPYAQWGKSLHGDWVVPPRQFALVHSDARTSWGLFLLKDKDFERNRHVYVYGRREGKLVVARVACRDADDFVRFGNWRFYSDGEWLESQEEATPIADHAATDFSIHESPAGHFVLIQSPPGLVPAISLAVASSPTGPFRARARFDLSTWRNESDRHRRYAYYAVSAHDGLSAGGHAGGMLISYVRSCAFSADAACRGGDADENRADVYVPRFIDLPWSVIDP
jgi:hypothetical protein